jgi:hypothetical protein
MITERQFTIEYRDWDSFLKNVQKLESEYHGLLIRAEIVGSIAKIVMLCGIGAKDIYMLMYGTVEPR